MNRGGRSHTLAPAPGPEVFLKALQKSGGRKCSGEAEATPGPEVFLKALQKSGVSHGGSPGDPRAPQGPACQWDWKSFLVVGGPDGRPGVKWMWLWASPRI